MAFDSQFIHWPTLGAFVAYLQSVPRPPWCNALTNHNTYHPNEAEWRGLASMQSMQATYIARGWTSGPHLYLAAQAPNPANTGIWQMTPITRPGTHAGACNPNHLGIESVGDFNARPPTPDQYTLLMAVNRAILMRWGIPPEKVNVHNECMAGRICPGKYLTGTQIRADLNKTWLPVPDRWPARVVGLPVYQQSDHSGALWGHLRSDQDVVIDDLSNGHVAEVDGQHAPIGFVDLKGLETR